MGQVRWRHDGDALAWGTAGISPAGLMAVAKRYARPIRLPVAIHSGSDMDNYGHTVSDKLGHVITLNVPCCMYAKVSMVWNTSTHRFSGQLAPLDVHDSIVVTVMTLIHELRHAWQFEKWPAKEHEAQVAEIHCDAMRFSFSRIEMDAEIFERKHLARALEIFYANE